ncbi:MAG: thioesterase family protein [Planctomycetota bacterium]|nr:thioesterase family protein [Planctomycetota bacterium]
MFQTTVRVRYAETDRFGVVYHSNYFLYMETGRTEYLRSLGLPYSELEKKGIYLVVTECGCRFRAPATYDDMLKVATRIGARTKTRVRFDYDIENAESGKPLAHGFTTLACVDKTGRPAQIPPDLAAMLERAETS